MKLKLKSKIVDSRPTIDIQEESVSGGDPVVHDEIIDPSYIETKSLEINEKVRDFLKKMYPLVLPVLTEDYITKKHYTATGGDVNEVFDSNVFEFALAVKRGHEIENLWEILIWNLSMKSTKLVRGDKFWLLINALGLRLIDNYYFIQRREVDKRSKEELEIRGLYGEEVKKRSRCLFETIWGVEPGVGCYYQKWDV